MQQEMSSLIDIIHVVEKNARAKTSSTHDGICTALRSEAPYLVLCFYFVKNRARICEWLGTEFDSVKVTLFYVLMQ